MKYIKTFNENNSESYLENQSINWDLIQSAKDLALEHLDDGYELEWTVDNFQSDHRTYLVVAGVFDHNEDKIHWGEHYDEDYVFDKDKLIYDFYFSRTKYGKVSYSIDESRELTTKLNDRLIEMYPGEKFQELE